MKTNKNKPNGIKLTINYLGLLNDKFGIKKKKIILEEDKLESIFNFRNSNHFLLSSLKKNNTYSQKLENKNKIKINYKEKNSFESIKIKDWEKTNNFYFYNFITNLKYMNRINSSKRNLISKNLKYYRNNSSKLISKNEKSKDKNIDFYFHSAKNNKKVFLKSEKDFSLTFTQKKQLSKIKISKIISNFNLQKNNNQNRNINNILKINNIKLDSNSFNKNNNNSNNSNNNILTNNYIINNSTNNNYINNEWYINNLHNNYIYNLYLKYNKYKKGNLEKKNKISSAKFNSYNEPQNNFNNIKPIPIRNKNTVLHINKKKKDFGSLCDVGTNTEL